MIGELALVTIWKSGLCFLGKIFLILYSMAIPSVKKYPNPLNLADSEMTKDFDFSNV